MGLVNSVAQITGSDKHRAGAYLVELLDDDSPDPSSFRPFQYYPETINDSRGVNYSSKEVIGLSHPIYQWVHGSERTISFEAVFTSDYTEKDDLASSITTAISAFKNPVAAGISLLKGKDPNGIPVDQYVAWLRSKTYPKYTGSKPVGAPPKLLLWLEGSKITSYAGGYTVDVVPVIMRRCDVTYEAFFRTGAPRIATVSLEFAETIQVGQNWSAVNRSDVEISWSNKLVNTSDKTLPPGAPPAFGNFLNGLPSLPSLPSLPKIGF